MHPSSHNRAVDQRTYVNRAVDDMHAWIVANVEPPVSHATLDRMRRVYMMGLVISKDGTLTPDQQETITEYRALTDLYANRPLDGEEEEDTYHVGTWYLALVIIVAALALAGGYGLWRWLN